MSDAAEKLPNNGHGTIPKGLIPWKPGQSGNPSGFNVMHSMMRRVREATNNGQDLIDVLKELLADNNPVVRLKACEMLWDRGWGKPKEPKDEAGTHKTWDISKLSADKQQELINVLKVILGV